MEFKNTTSMFVYLTPNFNHLIRFGNTYFKYCKTEPLEISHLSLKP